jgi:DNA-binding protein Alba
MMLNGGTNVDILIGDKKSFIYKNIALFKLTDKEPICFKARGRAIVTAVDSWEILRREIAQRYPTWEVEHAIDTDSIAMKRQEKDEKKGSTINVSEIIIDVKRLK